MACIKPGRRTLTTHTFTKVTAHHEDLLIHASNVRQLSMSLASVRQGLGDVELSIDK